MGSKSLNPGTQEAHLFTVILEQVNQKKGPKLVTSLPSVHTSYYKIWILTVTRSSFQISLGALCVKPELSKKKGKTVSLCRKQSVSTHFPSVAHKNSSLSCLCPCHTLSFLLIPCPVIHAREKVICIIWIKLICYPGVHTKSASFLRGGECRAEKATALLGTCAPCCKGWSILWGIGCNTRVYNTKALQRNHFSHGRFRLSVRESPLLSTM